MVSCIAFDGTKRKKNQTKKGGNLNIYYFPFTGLTSKIGDIDHSTWMSITPKLFDVTEFHVYLKFHEFSEAIVLEVTS